MGRRVRDLQVAGYSNVAIARHCGCHHEQIRRLIEDPRISPRYTTGVMLLQLHENVTTGISPWGRMLKALRHHGFTYEQIARLVGTNTAYLRDSLAQNPAKIPNHYIGSKLRDLYTRHVGPTK